MAGDPSDEFLDPEAVKQQQSLANEVVAEEDAEANQGLMRRLASRASQSFKKGMQVVSNLVVTPKEEKSDEASKQSEEAAEDPAEGTDVPGAVAADPAKDDDKKSKFELSSESMERKQEETRLRIQEENEMRKASMRKKLALAQEQQKSGKAFDLGDDSDEEMELAAKLVKAASKRKSEYEEAMSDKLPVVQDELDYDEAAENWRHSAVTDKRGQPIPFWSSTLTDIEFLGVGIGLWFRTLKAMTLYFFVMSIPGMMIVGHYLYLFYNEKSDLTEDTLDVMARLTTGVAATTTQRESVAGWDIRTVMFAISVMDCFAILVFLILVAYLKRRQTAYIAENDDAVISLPDYSVMAWGIPKDATADEVSKHFEQFGVVADCVVVKDRGTVMGTRMKRSKLLDQLVALKIDAAYYEAKGRTALLTLQKKRIEKKKEAIIKCDETIQEKLKKGFDSVCAFVTFEESKYRANCVTEFKRGTYLQGLFQSDKLRFRDEHVIKLKPAPESSDVLWENVLRVHPVVKFLRKFLSYLCIFALLLCAIGVVVYAKDSLEKSPPSVLCSTTVKDPLTNPTPNLECNAIWPLLEQNANTNKTSVARKAVEAYVANVDYTKCAGFINGNEWAKPMAKYAPFTDAMDVSKLPKAGETWTGGFIPETQADECAAVTCQKCYCTSIVSFSSLNDLLRAYYNSQKTGASEDLCSEVFDQILLEAAVQFGTIAVTAVTNMILMSSAAFFSKFERHKTLSSTEASASKYTFLALFVNQALVPIIIYSLIEFLEGFPVFFQGPFSDFESAWYNKVMVMLIGSALINAFSFPLARCAPAIIGAVTRTFTGCCAHSQRALNKMYTPTKFELSQRYGQILCVMFYTIIFFAAAPPLFPFAAILFFLLYAVDKYMLLKTSKKPPMYDYKLNDLFLTYAPYACWLHLAVATWAFGHHNIPSYIIDPGNVVPGDNARLAATIASLSLPANATDTTTDFTGKPDQFDVMHRLVRANALLPFACFVLLTASLFLAKFFESFVGIFAGVCTLCFEEKEKEDDVAPFSTLCVPGDDRYEDPSTNPNIKLSGLRSYRIEDNPEYMMLFPEVLDVGNSIKFD